MSSLKSFIIECGYLNVFVAVGPMPVRIALPSLSLSLCKGKQKKGDFFFLFPPSCSQTVSPVAPFVLVVSYGMLGENATLSIPFEITFLVGCIQSGSGGLGR